MNREVTLQARVDAIIKAWLTPYLKERGFEKNGRVYTRKAGRILHLLDVTRDSYNKHEKTSFALRVGIYVPGVMQHFWKWPPPQKPKKLDTSDGLIHCGPGLLMTPKRAQWWDVTSSGGSEHDEAVGRDAREVVEVGGFQRFFDRFPHERNVAEFLVEPRTKADQQIFPQSDGLCLVYAGIIWDQLGEYDKCRATMAQAVEVAKGKKLLERSEKFAREYVCGQFPRVDSAHVEKP